MQTRAATSPRSGRARTFPSSTRTKLDSQPIPRSAQIPRVIGVACEDDLAPTGLAGESGHTESSAAPALSEIVFTVDDCPPTKSEASSMLGFAAPAEKLTALIDGLEQADAER